MDRKRYASVICEYNPFHFGHKFQMDELKKNFDGVICIMSGNIVQRGSIAVADKYLRAEAALNCGADLVLELPVPWCCSSAHDFAASGVYIADCIGADVLAFGAEDGIDLLEEICALAEKEDFHNAVKSISAENKSLSYPQAVTEAVRRNSGENAAEAMKKPNNILALEYMKSLKGTQTEPFVIKRNPEFLSSSEIRSRKNGVDILGLLPDESRSVFERENGKTFPREGNKLDSFFIGSLRRMNASGKMPGLVYSAPDDLIKKILQGAVKCSNCDDLVLYCSDKNYTHARVRRAINAIVFGITADKVKQKPPFTSVLAANKAGREILRNAKKKGRIDIINKPVRAMKFGEKTKNAFLFAKGIEDVIALADIQPLPADTAKNPTIGEL